MKPSFRSLAFLIPNGERQLRASRISCCLFSLGAFVLAGSQSAQAIDIYWNYNSATSVNGHGWDKKADWSTSSSANTPNPSQEPGIGDIAHFNISSVTTPVVVDLNKDQSALGLDFLSPGTVSILGGGTNQTLTLAGSGMTKSGAGAVTIGSTTSGQQVALALSADQTWANSNNNGAINVLNGVASTTAVARTLTLGGTSTAANAVSGVIANNGAGVMSLTKSGAGTWSLSGANTNSGLTTVSEGKLLVNNTTGSGTGTGAVSVGGAATLGGNGFIKPSSTNGITVASTGKLAPGANNSIGKLTVDLSGTTGNVTMSSGSLFDWQLSGNGGTPDQVSIVSYGTGDFVLNNNAINFALTGTEAAGNYTVTLFRFFSDAAGTILTPSGISSGLALGTLTGSFSGTPTFNYGTTGEIRLNYSVVPEPTSALAGILLGAGLLRRKRR